MFPEGKWLLNDVYDINIRISEDYDIDDRQQLTRNLNIIAFDGASMLESVAQSSDFWEKVAWVELPHDNWNTDRMRLVQLRSLMDGVS